MDSPPAEPGETLREAPTHEEILQFAAQLPEDQAQQFLAKVHPAPSRPAPTRNLKPTPPIYDSWAQFLAQTTTSERLRWCRTKAHKANSTRLMSGPPDMKITAQDVWVILEAAQGRCAHCGSLAVEHRPSTPEGKPMPWEHVGRRIGSLGHKLARFNGGSNTPENLCWSCLWCNTWPTERHPRATDHGGYHPAD